MIVEKIKSRFELKKIRKLLLLFFLLIERLLVQFLMGLGCWHIITVICQQKADIYAGVLALLWSCNLFWFDDYANWFRKIR